MTATHSTLGSLQNPYANSIRSLEKNDFKNFGRLQALNISQNNINKIEDGAFIHTSHLEFLNLSANQLQLLSSSMFDGLMNLTTLLLASNKIYRINPSAFANLENLKKQKRKGQGTGYDYDAFLSYNTHDEKWVVDDLLPVLEKQYSWKVCLHHRDFEPGRSILENIVDNIYASRKTICIISHHYLESEWCSKEIQVASFRIFDDHKDVLVLIFLEDIPAEYLSPYHKMRKLLKTKTYLKWPEDEREIPLFWHKLNMAMKTGDGKEYENPVLAGFVPDEIP
ncbi:Toll-like receptor 13, partial [Ophiophagus hannah]